jgi:EAL domain-containing protein (putative c-di-GMP-specific phosphodiesterase class I)
MLTALGCDTLQGFFFSPPVAADEVPALARGGTAH